MPFIRCDRATADDLARHREADQWYGCKPDDYSAEAIDDRLGQRLAAGYLRRNLPAICARFGGGAGVPLAVGDPTRAGG